MQQMLVPNAGDSVATRIAYVLREHPDKPAFSLWKEETHTFADVARTAAAVHRLLAELNIQKGDRIAIVGRNSINWAEAFISIVTYGAVIVPILHEFREANIAHIVNHSEALVLFSTDNIWERLAEEQMPNLKGVISLTDWRLLHSTHTAHASGSNPLIQYSEELKSLNFNPSELRCADPDPEDLFEINYTSGTSGFSKGVMQPNRALLSNLEFASNVLPLQPGDPILSILPLAHAFGQAFEFLYSFSRGCHIYFLAQPPSPKILASAFEDIAPRLVFLVPLILEKIYRNRIAPELRKPHIRVMLSMPLLRDLVHRRIASALNKLFGGNFIEVIIGGASLSPEVETFLHDVGFRYTVGYGMTECAPIISYSPHATHRVATVGKEVINVKIRINEPDEQGVGEIQVGGKNLMLGYYNRPDLTADAFTPDGWMRTGDLGYLDPEGYLSIKGRSKNMILGPSGQNIYPEEIEATINAQQYVLESIVQLEDGNIIALVVPDYAALDRDGLSEKEFTALLPDYIARINRLLPAYSQIAKIYLRPEEFEKTPKHSIKRFLYTHVDNPS